MKSWQITAITLTLAVAIVWGINYAAAQVLDIPEPTIRDAGLFAAGGLLWLGIGMVRRYLKK